MTKSWPRFRIIKISVSPRNQCDRAHQCGRVRLNECRDSFLQACSDEAREVASKAPSAFTTLSSVLTDARAAWATGTKASIAEVGRAFAAPRVQKGVQVAVPPPVGMIAGFAGGFFTLH